MSTRLDRDEYRPGDRARLTFALSDERGRPAAGAISLAAVDEAVSSVLARFTAFSLSGIVVASLATTFDARAARADASPLPIHRACLSTRPRLSFAGVSFSA
jgi:hypothetical protein